MHQIPTHAFLLSPIACADRVTVEVIGGEEDASISLLETSLLAWASDWSDNVLPEKNVTIDAPNIT